MVELTRRNFGLAAGMATAVGLTAAALIAFSSAEAQTVVEPGTVAPAFSDAATAQGETVSLSDFEGKTVVLEWTNHDCPFVKKHYATPPANMQSLQAEAGEAEIVWLQVISSAPGKQGHVSSEQAVQLNTDRGAVPAYTIIDESGDIGRAYGAKTTPHMYVIKGDGMLAYNGAIDSIRSASVDDIAKADPYFQDAVNAVIAGEPVPLATSAPYGCSVKY
ncbi:redoxin domain-containing protein [Hyphomonas sp. FCG-A18]|uniref:redoxin domain-containing protein n=1 Tax=Hyphomonas sp. FCG-A18 TaxID=3080019 RepID=UPI002B31E16A|nr:redoxin domain-containing protein [Hyphomonas sp. FCG-A18]